MRSVIGEGPHALHQPYLAGREQEYTAQVIASGHLSAGKWVERFENELAAFVGARHAIAVCNATCGLHVALVAAGYDDRFTHKIPALTFVATANAAYEARCGITFCEPEDATLPVSILGRPLESTKGYVWDTAQALGTRGIGNRSELAVFSFNQNKIITTGGGGAVTTNDGMMAGRLRHLVTTARIPHPWEVAHDNIAYNYRLSDLQAAIGCAQLEQLPLILKAKRALASRYIEAFRTVDGAKVWEEPPGSESNYWLVSILLNNPQELVPTLELLHSKGIQARRLPKPLHMLKMYKNCPRDDLSKTENLYARIICLPSSPKLGLQYI